MKPCDEDMVAEEMHAGEVYRLRTGYRMEPCDPIGRRLLRLAGDTNLLSLANTNSTLRQEVLYTQIDDEQAT